MRRPIATAALLLVIATAAFVPAANAQDAVLNSCSYSPSELTLRPGESVDVIVTTDPVEATAFVQTTLDGEILTDFFPTLLPTSPFTAPTAYDAIIEAFAEDDIFITSGVILQSIAVVVGEGEDERFETLCTFTVNLVGEPEPTTTTVAPEPEPTPNPEPATPRFTG